MFGSGRWSLVACLALVACGQSGNNAGDDADEEILPPTADSQVFGDYVVNFNAVATIDLNPTIAEEYGIIRRPNGIMLNINVRDTRAGGAGVAVPAEVKASATNLTGQFRNLNTRLETGAGALYYIAETQVQNGETLIFTVEATPEGKTEPLTVRFRKQFFIND